MKLALAQTNPVWMEGSLNRGHAEALVREAAEASCDLIAFPEMSFTGYQADASGCAEPVDGPTANWMAGQAEENRIHIVAGVAIRAGDILRNGVLTAGPDGVVRHIYDKVHPFSFAGEEHFITPGDHWGRIKIGDVSISLSVCYDLRFPELFTTQAESAHLFLVIANWPAPRHAHWLPLLQARSLDSLAYVAGVNRVGEGGGLRYHGGSAVFSPWGELVAGAHSTDEQLIVADIVTDRVAETRTGFSLLEDRRPELYARLSK